MSRLLALLALMTATVFAPVASAEMTQAQRDAAGQVYTGDADCELKQTVNLKPVEGKPGHFELLFKKVRYLLVRQETTTGAVRLEDNNAGVVWIQIPAKSMLLSSKLGQRMIDSCRHPEQVMEASLSPPTTNSFGLSGGAR